MSLWQKLGLTLHTSQRCASCNTTLGIDQTAWGWLTAGSIPFSLSALVPLPLKFVLGSIGIGLMLFPYLFLIPLVEKPEEAGRPSPPAWLMPWILILSICTFSTDWINWIPEQSTRLIALLTSVTCSIPIVHLAWRRIPKADEKIAAFGVGALLLITLHYFPLSVLPPTLITLAAGSHTTTEAVIVRTSRSYKLTRCENKIDIQLDGESNKHELCVSEDVRKAARTGDRLTLDLRQTGFGRLIVNIRAGSQL